MTVNLAPPNVLTPDAISRARRVLVLGVVAFALLSGAAGVWLLASDTGRAWICARINASVSQQMAGRLLIEHIDEVRPPRVKAGRVRILAPDGQPAIDVESADIDFDLKSLLRGDFVWRRADIRNGTVWVTEDARGRINMEETFKARSPQPTVAHEADVDAQSKDDGELDMRTMVTSNMSLIIRGGELPSLRLVQIHGIMRVHVDRRGVTQIRFDDYRGHFVEGLPHGQLVFREVKGHVQTDHRRLLRFEGEGDFQQEKVAFALDVFTGPRDHVKIDAYFPELSAATLSTLGVSAWSKLTPTLEIDVRHGP
jgi:hypothetical protein